jgi:hypothetical protein
MSSADSVVRLSNSRRLSARSKAGKQPARPRNSDPDAERVRARDRLRADRHKLHPPHTKDLSGVSALTNFLRPHPAINSASGFPFSNPLGPLTAEIPQPTRTSTGARSHGDRAGTPRRERHHDSTRNLSRSKAASSSSPTKRYSRSGDPSRRPPSIRRRSSREVDTASEEIHGLSPSPSNQLTIHHSPSRRSASDVTAVAEAVTQLHPQPQSHKKDPSSDSSILSSALSAAYQ